MDRADLLSKFLESLSFSPYPFQEEALLAWFETNAGTLICAPTGMGKTLIAEAAVFEALNTRKRLYYTTPLIALTEQKFRETSPSAGASRATTSASSPATAARTPTRSSASSSPKSC